MFKMIIVGTDCSNRAGVAVEHAAELANLVGAELRIVAVHRIYPSAHSLTQFASRSIPYEADEAYDVEFHRNFLEPLAERLRRRGLAVKLHVVAGNPAEVLTGLAEELHADAVVIGDRGVRGFRRLFGSVAATVVRTAKVPVLVVPTG